MARATQRDNFVIFAVGASFAVVIIGFALTWLYFKQVHRFTPPIAYTSFGPVVIRAADFSMKASLAVQTSKADAKWAKENQQALGFALETALSNTDAERLRTPDGLANLQTSLKEAVDAAFHSSHVEQVLLTDFVLQSR
jgi:flagellar basal body-associated protein FliL